MCASVCFNETSTTKIYTLSLHDALPICRLRRDAGRPAAVGRGAAPAGPGQRPRPGARHRALVQPGGRHPGHARSEEHTSELQSRQYLVCRLLLEKKKLVTCMNLMR